MNLLKRGVTAVLSGVLVLSSITSLSTPVSISAEDYIINELSFSMSSDVALQAGIISSNLYEDAVSTETATENTVVTTTISAEAAEAVTTTTTTAVASTEAIVTDDTSGDSYFNVFDIYDAHVKYLASTTTTTTTTTTTVTTTTTTTTTTPKIYYGQNEGVMGIDVSKWQGEIDWQKVKAAGVNFAIIRAGYGKLASQEDPMFDKNIKAAKEAGIDCGIYWYSYANSVEEAYQEAEVCYSVIKEYSFEYPVFFDIEENFQRDDLSTATVSLIVEAFCSTLESKGYYVSVYSYASFLNTKIYASVLDKYDVWVAHFNVSQPDISRSYGMWQYSETGKVDGISTNVDLDYAYVNYPYLITSKNKNGY